MGEERDGVDAVGQGSHVGPAGACGEAVGLPGVEEVADQQRDGRAREDAAVDQFVGEAEDALAEADDEQELDEVVERQAEEAVEVAADEQAHRSLCRGCGGWSSW